jgi:DNA-directed RNA polymerase specialized sigma24 family protein
MMAEWTYWADQGLTMREAAAKVGVKLSALRRAIYRHRAAQRADSAVPPIDTSVLGW